MVEKRGEPLLPPLPCSLPYAVQRLGHAFPDLSPVRALLLRVPLSPCPWLHRLRCRRPALFGGFTATTAECDFSGSCIGDYGSSPSRRGPSAQRGFRPTRRPPGSRTWSVHTCQVLRPRRVAQALALALLDMLPSATQTASAPGISFLSRLNGWPARSPTDASPTSSRMPAHGSGPMWFAIPSS